MPGPVKSVGALDTAALRGVLDTHKPTGWHAGDGPESKSRVLSLFGPALRRVRGSRSPDVQRPLPGLVAHQVRITTGEPVVDDTVHTAVDSDRYHSRHPWQSGRRITFEPAPAGATRGRRN
ncbi:hypothetical protein ACFW1M_14775 [Streptomyces inhibens]|uniref:hypothetical protein n=1 Tax=Streptomyces inhibens TaxID=2293571 RepID=UPI0036BFBFDB